MQLEATSLETGSRSLSNRILGLDIARAFAVIGMVIVNFKIVSATGESGPSWLLTATSALEGRAAATFVVLAGIGASLASRGAREGGDPEERRQARRSLLRRAAFLFVFGWLFFLVWPADILHFYGVYLAIGAAVLFASDRWLHALAGASVLVSFVFILSFDYFSHWNLEDLSYQGLATPGGFFRNLFFDGFHPVFPWVAFYFVGLWLGRKDLRDKRWRRALFLSSAVVVVVVEAAAWFLLGPKGGGLDHVPEESWRWLFYVAPIPPLPLYVVAGTGTALLAILSAIWLEENLPERVSEPWVSTGQLAFTLYFAHVVVGMGLLELVGRLEAQSLSWAVTSSLVFCLAAVLASRAWRRRFRRGPLEALLRRFAG